MSGEDSFDVVQSISNQSVEGSQAGEGRHGQEDGRMGMRGTSWNASYIRVVSKTSNPLRGANRRLVLPDVSDIGQEQGRLLSHCVALAENSTVNHVRSDRGPTNRVPS